MWFPRKIESVEGIDTSAINNNRLAVIRCAVVTKAKDAIGAKAVAGGTCVRPVLHSSVPALTDRVPLNDGLLLFRTRVPGPALVKLAVPASGAVMTALPSTVMVELSTTTRLLSPVKV